MEIIDTNKLKFQRNMYSLYASTISPQLVIILINSSSSMIYYIKGKQKIQLASKYINQLIYNIIHCNFDGEKPRNSYHFKIISYSDIPSLIIYGNLPNLYESPIRVEKIKKKISDGVGYLIEIDFLKPIWIDIKANKNSKNNIPLAINFSNYLIRKWRSDNNLSEEQFLSKSLAPIILNITDNIFLSEENYFETKISLENLFSIHFPDGDSLFYNFIISSNNEFFDFPKLIKDPLDTYSLLNLTSLIPSNHKNILFRITQDDELLEENLIGLTSDFYKITNLVSVTGSNSL